MNIKKIVLTNFKNFTDKTIELKDSNTITGANGVGKTSVYHAIEFAIFGTIDGSSKVDRFIHNDTDQMTVVIFTDKGVISRKRTRTSTTLKLNEMPVKQDDINSAVGVPYTDFLSATRVGYFMGLDNASKRRILLEITKPVDKREIFDRLVDNDTLADELHINFDELDITFKSVKAQYNLLDSQQTMHLANRKLLNEQIVEVENDLKETKEIDASVLKKKLAEITDKRNKEEARITEANEDRIALQIELERLNGPEELFEVDTTEAKAKSELTKLKKELKALPVGNCDKCGQPLPNDKKEIIENSIRFYEEAQKALVENKEINKRNKAIEKKRKELEKKLTEHKEADNRLLQELNHKWNNINEEINQANISNAQRETAENNLANLKVKLHQELESSIESELFKYEKAYNALKPSGLLVEELKLKKEELDAKTKNIYTFEFLKKNKNGDKYTEVVELYRDGLEYVQMSMGQKMRADINLSRVISKYYGINFLFIDNAELIDVEVKPLKGEQLFSVYVKAGAELTIK